MIESYSSDFVAVAAETACRRIPPVWELTAFVAVNPFVGFSDVPITDVSRQVMDAYGAEVLPDITYFRNQWKKGAINLYRLENASRLHGIEPHTLLDILENKMTVPEVEYPMTRLIAEGAGTRRAETLKALVSRWLVNTIGSFPTEPGTPPAADFLYKRMMTIAKTDRSSDVYGLGAWREMLALMPENSADALHHAVRQTTLSTEMLEKYFYKLLCTQYGWASLLRRWTWQCGEQQFTLVTELLAFLACCDIAAGAGAAPIELDTIIGVVEDERYRIALQESVEDQYIQSVVGQLTETPLSQPQRRPTVQAVFCIDVRSEPLRRQLEEQSDLIQTRGFAGFFGISVRWNIYGRSSSRCPVLLKPAVTLHPELNNPGPALSATKSIVKNAPAVFSFVETFGMRYAVKMIGDTFGLNRQEMNPEWTTPISFESGEDGHGLTLDSQIAIAMSITKFTGLRSDFAPLVVFCGHEGQSENNSHAAGLDCGACGGHGGALNARVAATIMNNPDVRIALRQSGVDVPADTWFVAAVHNTSNEEVIFLDQESVPLEHRSHIESLGRHFAAASLAVRSERAKTVGIALKGNQTLSEFDRRARDWSIVRPEWGLARNASFIAARRIRTHDANLEGRAFLHEYDWTDDADSSVLRLILSAPLVVASWINLQYFASTVDPEKFGCGPKALQNRVGTLGVIQGNGGDLRTGLSLESVQAPDGSNFHEPLRLQAIIEAPMEMIDDCLSSLPDVSNLISNGWIRLFALDPEINEIQRKLPDGHWQLWV